MKDFLRGASSGYIQEEIVNYTLSLLDNSKHLSNLDFYSFKLRKITEIDMVLITPTHIYCIEVKSYKTKIVGNFCDKMWSGFTGTYLTMFYNPMFQNLEHLRTLKNNLRRNGHPVYDITPYMIVPNSCDVRSDCENIVTLSEFMRIAKDNAISCEKRFDVDSVYNVIKRLGVV